MKALDDLTSLLKRIPGIGPKSASRIAYQLVRTKPEFNALLAQNIAQIQEKIHQCSVCGSYTETDPCPVCSDQSRNHNVICIVEQPQDVLTIQSLGVFDGVFHVLGGALNPLAGIGPENLSFSKLMDRIKGETFSEVIIATNPTECGNVTAMYLRKILSDYPQIKITRLATGLPFGGDLEFSDKRTLVNSINARIPF